MKECGTCGYPIFRSKHAEWCFEVTWALIVEHPDICLKAHCDRSHFAKGLCERHYEQVARAYQSG
jgi:hypothetical protein